MLGEYFEDLVNVKGCFIGDYDYPEYDFNIFLLLKKDNSKEYKDFLKYIKRKVEFVKTYDPDKFYTMLVFNIPDQHTEDYELFRDSKYSKVSPVYKEHILTFFNIRGDHSVSRVLYRDERQRIKIEEEIGIELPRDAEVASALREEQEVYSEDMKVKVNKSNSDLIPE